MIAHASQSREESRESTISASPQVMIRIVSKLRELDELITPFEKKDWRHDRRIEFINFYERVLKGNYRMTGEDYRDLIDILVYQLEPPRADLPVVAVSSIGLSVDETKVFLNTVPIEKSEVVLDFDSALYYCEYIALLVDTFRLTKKLERELLRDGRLSPNRLLYCLCYPCALFHSEAVLKYGSEWAALRAESRVIPSPQISESCLASMRISRGIAWRDSKD